MLVVSAFKTWKVLPALVACLLAVAAVVCLVHTDGIDSADCPPGTSPYLFVLCGTPHTRSALSCGYPPGVVVLVWLCLGALCFSVLLSKPVVPAFPPFIPPKDTAYV